MEFVFNNIDEAYIKNKREFMGDIQPKYWFSTKDHSILVKRQHSQPVIGQSAKSKMYNHFGEYFGFILAQKAGVKACPVDLITVHDIRNKYAKSLRLYTACGSKKVLQQNQDMLLGEAVINAFEYKYPSQYNKIIVTEHCEKLPSDKKHITIEKVDNVDIVIASVIAKTIDFEKGRYSKKEIDADINENLKDAFDMIAYDCLLGNNDRHSENWAMYTDVETGKVKMYPLYDNERVLGLSRPEVEMKRAVQKDNLEDTTEEECFSRMGISPVHSGVSYKQMLVYLIQKYPEYTIPAIKRITDNISVQDIDELFEASEGITTRSKFSDELTEADELPSEYRTYANALYSSRREYARNLLERYKDNKIIKNKSAEKDLMVI
jgi:hypothetical protein